MGCERLRGKVAIVTGGASGIGGVSSATMAREGAKVVVADRNGAGADAVSEESRAAGEPRWGATEAASAAARP